MSHCIRIDRSVHVPSQCPSQEQVAVEPEGLGVLAALVAKVV